MILPIFRPEAAADVEEAFRWYEARSPGLGDEFLAAMKVAVEAILQNPERYPVIHRKTRRILLKRFPYNLYYRIVDSQVVVVACFHGRRNPRVWRRRK